MTDQLIDNKRGTKVKYICDNIMLLRDDSLNEMHPKLFVSTESNEKEEKNSVEIAKLIANNISYFNDNMIEYIEKNIKKSLSKKENPNEKKLRIALEITNKILKKHDLPPIYDLCEFKDFSREKMLCDECKNVINDNKKYIFDNGFDKIKCGAYQKTQENQHFSIFKGILSQVGHKLCSKTRNSYATGTRLVKTFYYIKKT